MGMIFGFFDNARAAFPAHDPGLSVDCPLCGEKLSKPVITTSFMRSGDDKSYFYRTHKDCDITASPQDIQVIESAVVDAKEMTRLPMYNN